MLVSTKQKGRNGVTLVVPSFVDVRMPLTYHDPKRHTEKLRHVLLAPAGRVEVIIKGPKPSRTTSLRSLCVNTGADGGPNPEMVLADLDTSARESALTQFVQARP
jgi:hypothetical protein